MDTKHIVELRETMNVLSTDELLTIWRENDCGEYTDETFEAIRQILIKRGGEIPPQAAPSSRTDLQDRDAMKPFDRFRLWGGIVTGTIAYLWVNITFFNPPWFDPPEMAWNHMPFWVGVFSFAVGAVAFLISHGVMNWMKDPKQRKQSPFAMQAIRNLFVQPGRFFSSVPTLGAWPYLHLVVWSLGITNAMSRVDKLMVKQDLGKTGDAWEQIGHLFMAWYLYWPFILVIGVIMGWIMWWVGGWWYRLRIQWSGASNPDPKLARIIYVYTDFIANGPIILWVIVQTVIYDNYREAWNQDQVAYFLGIFLAWSIVSSYRAVRDQFSVSKRKAIVWFLVVPSVFYLGLGTMIAGIYLVGSDGQ